MLTELARSFYRSLIYANDIDDWVVADTIGNSLGTVTATFLIIMLAGRGTNGDWRLVVMVSLGLLGYEALNPLGQHTFDVNDALGTLIGGGVSALTYAFILIRLLLLPNCS